MRPSALIISAPTLRANRGLETRQIRGLKGKYPLGHRGIGRFNDQGQTINAVSTVSLLELIAAAYPAAKKIMVILDNARYYRSKVEAECLQNSRIDLIFLPPYSPYLNLIERFWEFFKIKCSIMNITKPSINLNQRAKNFSMISKITTSSYDPCSLKISRLCGIKNRNPIWV